jgi:integrase/recombinase XerD
MHWLFEGKNNGKAIGRAMTRAGADLILRKACDRLGLVGVSTHSFRRTALTRMANAGVPLSVIQRISGHSSLATLQRYLEVNEAQVGEAISAI